MIFDYNAGKYCFERLSVSIDFPVCSVVYSTIVLLSKRRLIMIQPRYKQITCVPVSKTELPTNSCMKFSFMFNLVVNSNPELGTILVGTTNTKDILFIKMIKGQVPS